MQFCIRRKNTVPEPAEMCIRRLHSLCTFSPPLCRFTKLCITYAPSHAASHKWPRTSRKLHKGLHNLCSPLMQSHKEFINELAEDSLNVFLLEHTILGLHVRKMLYIVSFSHFRRDKEQRRKGEGLSRIWRAIFTFHTIFN